MSEKLSVQELLVKVMQEVEAVKKTDRNTAQNFSFRGIDAVVNAVGPALRKHGVVVTPEVIDYQYSTVEVGRNRTQMAHVIVKVKYAFYGAGGDSISATVIGEAMDAGDKATPKAMSVAFRIALLQALALPTDEPDPDSYSYERADAKPTATSDQIQGWLVQLQGATNDQELNSLARTIAGYEMDEKSKTELRLAYQERQRELAENVEALQE